jgi:hypothetical protein
MKEPPDAYRSHLPCGLLQPNINKTHTRLRREHLWRMVFARQLLYQVEENLGVNYFSRYCRASQISVTRLE